MAQYLEHERSNFVITAWVSFIPSRVEEVNSKCSFVERSRESCEVLALSGSAGVAQEGSDELK